MEPQVSPELAGKVHPGFAETPPTKLTKENIERYTKVYAKGWRQLRRWVDVGEKANDACPLHDPVLMPGWWSRHMKWRIPPEIEAAALEAARSARAPALEPAMPAVADDEGSSPPDPSAAPGDASRKHAPPPAKAIDIESFDPEEGDRLRELKQIQAAKFQQLKAALKAGEESSVIEVKYVKLCETIDKIESRVTERLKKRGLLILRAEVERDLAANAELMRQLDESQERRVLERCSSLTAEQRNEVSDAIRHTNRAKERILSRLDSLAADDLLRELAA